MLLVATVLVACPAYAQGPSFTARLGRNPVGLGESFPFEISLSVDGGGMEDYRPPDFRGFRVLVEQPSQSTQIQMGGGGSFMRQNYTWHYELVPVQKGKLTIASATVRAGGRTLATEKVTVNVVDAGQAPAPPQPRTRLPRGIPGFPGSFLFPDLEPDEEPEPAPAPAAPGQGLPAGRHNFLRVVPSKTRAYVGEQITVEWSLCLVERQTNYAPTKEARTDGFWVEELEVPSQGGHLSLSEQVVDGHVYLVGPLMRKALFGLRPGRYTITPLEADISRADFFHVRSEHLKADPVTIEIMPLPAGAPADFNPSAVGRYRLAAELDRDHVQVGDAVTLKLSLEGEGNLHEVPLPGLPVMEGFRVYDPKIHVALSRAGGAVTGSKTAEYLLLPERPGETTIAPFKLATFDPSKGSYTTLKTSPLRLTVTGEARPQPSNPPLATSSPAAAGSENLLGLQVRPIHSHPALHRDLGAALYRSPYLLGVVAAPPGLLALLSLFGVARARMSRESEGKRQRRLRRSVNRRLRTAAALWRAGKLAPSLAEIERVLSELLLGKVGRTVVGMSRAELRAALVALGASLTLVDGTLAALDTCDRARFAPGSISTEEASATIEGASEIIEDFEKLGARPRGEA